MPRKINKNQKVRCHQKHIVADLPLKPIIVIGKLGEGKSNYMQRILIEILADKKCQPLEKNNA